MKKTYKVEVDCANCAAKMELAAAKVEFEESAVPAEVMPNVLAACRRIESDCEIFF